MSARLENAEPVDRMTSGCGHLGARCGAGSVSALLREADVRSIVRLASRLVTVSLGAQAAGAVLLDQPGTIVVAGSEERETSLGRLPSVDVAAEQLARWVASEAGRSAFCETPEEIRALWPDDARVAEALGLRSMACVPLVDETGPFGTFVVAFDRATVFDVDSRSFIEAVGADIQQALSPHPVERRRAGRQASGRPGGRARVAARLGVPGGSGLQVDRGTSRGVHRSARAPVRRPGHREAAGSRSRDRAVDERAIHDGTTSWSGSLRDDARRGGRGG